MLMLAWRMLARQRLRLVFMTLGLAVLSLLSLVQVGFLGGWCLTTSAIIRHADADLWIMAKNTPAFDYGAPIPSHRVIQTRNIPGVKWAEGMVMEWAMWQRPDGRRISVEIVGLDSRLTGGPWEMVEGDLQDVRQDDSVIVDSAYLKSLGVDSIGDELEIYGHRAVVRGVCHDVRTFTASPFVFCSLESSREFVQLIGDDHITYVVARCEDGASVSEVAERIRAGIPHVTVLTSSQFAKKTAWYWMLETGAGISVVMGAILAFTVTILVVAQSLHSITVDSREHYGVLKAIGFAGWKLAGIVLLQAGLLALVSVSLGTLVFQVIVGLTDGTPVALALPFPVYAALAGAFMSCCLVAGCLPIRTILLIDPGIVFRV